MQKVYVGNLAIGGGEPVRVESMITPPLTEPDQCLEQIEELAQLGAELLRVALPSKQEAKALKHLVKKSPIPLMADLHFDPELVYAALDAEIASIRLNPGNMNNAKVKNVIKATIDAHVVVRIGANGGSLSRDQIAEAHGDKSLALANAVTEQARLMLDNGQEHLIISAKCTDLRQALQANTLLKTRFPNFPFHIGITESGWGRDGLIKSAAGIGGLLLAGIGDTLRVSLSAHPREEVLAGYSLLSALGLRHRGGQMISCPTCGRKKLDTAYLAPLVHELLPTMPDGMTIAVMGCEVNGPGEARNADIGIAGTASGLVLFQKGKIVERCSFEEALDKLKALVSATVENRSGH